MERVLSIFAVFIVISHAGIADIQAILSPTGDDVSSKFVVVTPQDTIFGKSPAYLHFELLVQSQSSTPTTSMIAFHADRKGLIGDKETWCCTTLLYSLGLCENVGEILIRSKGALQLTNALSDKFYVDSEMKILYWSTLRPYLVNREEGGSSYINAMDHIEIKHTGMWYFVMAQCSLNQTERVTGTIEWRNPFGYLSGSSFANLPVYIILVSSYVGIFLVWIGFALYYRRGLMGLQHVITATIFVASLETLIWTIYFTYYNYFGTNLTAAMMLGAFVNALKVTSIRTLILLVSIGYSITRPELSSRTKICVTILSLGYIFTETSNQYIFIAKYVGAYVPAASEFFTAAVLSGLNVIYVVWTAYNINDNMIFLRQKNQEEKLSLYKIFAGALLIFMSLSILCFIFQMAFDAAGYHDSLWTFWWVWESYWQFSYLLLTMLIAFLWRPNPNNLRYAFSSQIPTENREEEPEELSGDVELDNVNETDNLSSDDNNNSLNNENSDDYDPDQLDQLAL